MNFSYSSHSTSEGLNAPFQEACDPRLLKEKLGLILGDASRVEKWFSPLNFSFSTAGEGTLHIYFPHELFFRWYLTVGKEKLRKAATTLLGTDINFSCEYPKPASPLLLNTSDFPSCLLKNSDSPLSYPSASFDTFIIGGKNKESIQMMRQALRGEPCTIFLHGASGSGKSHLLRAAALELYKISGTQPLLLSGRDLVSLFQNTPDSTYQALSCCSALIIDDIQLLEEYPQFQKELASLIDQISGERFILVSCQTEDGEAFRFLQAPLYDRLCEHLSIALAEPDLDVRLRFAQSEMEKAGLPEHRNTALFLARNCFRLRHIRGMISHLRLLYEQNTVIPSLEKLATLLDRSGAPQPSDIDSILAAVASHYGCSSTQLRENTKEKRLTLPRQIAMFLCRDILGESYPSIGLIFGGKDHSTVMYAIRKIEKLRVTNKDINIQLTELTKQCRNSVPRRERRV